MSTVRVSTSIGSIGSLSSLQKDLTFSEEWHNFSWFCFKLINEIPSANEVKEHLSSLLLNEERVQLIFHNVHLLDKLQKFVDEAFANQKKTQKDSKKFVELFESGNKQFMTGNYRPALTLYNEAMLYAICDKEKTFSSLTFCLANRSAVLYHIHRFNECIMDIDDAIKLNYPVDRRPKLLCRKSLCLKAIGKEHEAESAMREAETLMKDVVIDKDIKGMLEKYLQEHSIANSKEMPTDEELSGDPNDIPAFKHSSDIPAAANNVEMGTSLEKGRMLLALEAMEEGQLIVVERPFAHWLRPSRMCQFCYGCLKPVLFRFIPCKGCQTVRFCTVECAENTWNSHHNMECTHIEALNTFCVGQLALKIVYIAGVNECLKADKDGVKSLSEWKGSAFSGDYMSLYSLMGSGKNFNREQISIYATVACAMLLVAEKMQIIDRNNDSFFKIGGVLLRHIFQILNNTITVTDLRVRNTGKYEIFAQKEHPQIIGAGLYGAASLLNHSCDNNASKVFIDSKIVIFAKRSIEKKEEICVEYGTHIFKDTFTDRQWFLRKFCNFTCICKPCQQQFNSPLIAYKCPKCSGPLMCDRKGQNSCLQCKSENLDVSGHEKISQQIHTHLSDGQQAISKKKYKNAISELNEAYKLAFELYFSKCRFTEIIASLSYALEEKYQFKEAVQYIHEAIENAETLHGKDSLEVVNFKMKKVNILIKKAKNKTLFGKNSIKEEAKNVLNDSLQILQRIIRRQMKVAVASKLDFLNHIDSYAQYLGTKIEFETHIFKN